MPSGQCAASRVTHSAAPAIQHVPPGYERVEHAAFLFDEGVELAGIERPVARLGHGLEHPGVVVPQVTRVVLLARERKADGFENFLIRAQMQRFGVDQHAVEVEDDRRDHFGRPRSSPARTGIVIRFSRGGTGQSKVALNTQNGW